MGIHVQVWTGSRSARVTDMENAGKRGKLCRMLRFSGSGLAYSDKLDDASKEAINYTNSILYYLEHEVGGIGYDEVRTKVLAFVAEARAKGVQEWALGVHDEEIKGIAAPREVLTAGVEGKWSASADEGGISMRQLDDPNEWSEITHRQTYARAYEIARKVWPDVQKAKTLRDAAEVLRGAGARLHGYCAMD